MLVICAACAKGDRPSFQHEKPPFADTRISHSLCAEHAQAFRDQVAQLPDHRAASALPVEGAHP